ncbi:hypothetical protein IGI04_016646 [Brassica rapa subsp. trilocularis]|uniref:F-box domain-containing protein n=1 Tax=Brassica rapa subsp. trilocularis TaxID=1813537 RepID=A0ABQ7MTK8_BRACM|nr:hypothetical protein IGI04_016646 [Brassica rapa subsp. trilocularis]
MDSTKTKQKKKAAHEEQLPWELIEAILSRVPLKSLVRLSVNIKKLQHWLVDCDEFLICSMDQGAVVWNPWLKQSAWIGHPSSRLEGICYNGSNRRSELSSYKTICLTNFNFSKDIFSRFCDLPCGMSHLRDALVLRIFKGDRFSLLKQCNVTKNTEIWVTNNKVNVEDSRDVVWVNFIRLSIPSFLSLVPTNLYSQQPSYFIDDKRLVVCSCDETGQA